MEEIVKQVECTIVALLDEDQEFYTKLLLDLIEETKLPPEEAIKMFADEFLKHLRISIPITLVAA
ncbi:hypothetical protein [Pseudomonas sp. TWI929]|uniref:hypothetical protein n=1 Tax=Pseudomonas sp. TWI929 TaxID=3136795 RepID=UPI00320A650A